MEHVSNPDTPHHAWCGDPTTGLRVTNLDQLRRAVKSGSGYAPPCKRCLLAIRYVIDTSIDSAV